MDGSNRYFHQNADSSQKYRFYASSRRISHLPRTRYYWLYFSCSLFCCKQIELLSAFPGVCGRTVEWVELIDDNVAFVFMLPMEFSKRKHTYNGFHEWLYLAQKELSENEGRWTLAIRVTIEEQVGKNFAFLSKIFREGKNICSTISAESHLPLIMNQVPFFFVHF